MQLLLCSRTCGSAVRVRLVVPAVRSAVATFLALALLCASLLPVATVQAQQAVSVNPGNRLAARLAPPPNNGPLVVQVHFDLDDINEINDSAENFEFSGTLTLRWRDPRSAFDPAVLGVAEQVYQGADQINDYAQVWIPQVVLTNASGFHAVEGSLLRIAPDGTTTLVQIINAVAESEFHMQRFPFDRQRLEADFAVLGFDSQQVRLLDAGPAAADEATARTIRLPQWSIDSVRHAVEQRPGPGLVGDAMSSVYVVIAEAKRHPIYTLRLVVLPLILILLLSFSVFWMDRSSIGDRLNVSFIGILTAVAYLMVTAEHLPRIAYVTLIHGFLNLTMFTMAATVVVNIWVSVLDNRGRQADGDRLDARARWAFPLVFFGWLLLLVALAIRHGDRVG